MRSTPRRQFLRIAIMSGLVLIGAACSPSTVTIATPDSSASAGAAQQSTDPAEEALEPADLAARGMDVVESAPPALAPAFSSIDQVGELGFYYVVSDGDMSLVAFEAATLTPRYQVAAHPLGRARGIGQKILVDRDLGLVFVTGYDPNVGGEEGGYLAAHEAASGSEIWRTSIDFYAAQPFDCGRSLCIRSSREQRRVDKATGALVQFDRVSDRRVLYSGADLTITTLANIHTGAFIGVGGSSNYGIDNNWELTAEKLSRATGYQLEPGFGWSTMRFVSDDVVLIFFGRADGNGWAGVAIDTRTGRLLWSRPRVAPCVDSPRSDLPPVVCVTARDSYVVTSVERIDPRTGDTVWSTETDREAPELVYDGTRMIVWWFDEDGAGNLEVDLVTGELTSGPQTALCVLLNPWHEFEYPDGETAEWSSGLVFSMCLDDGYLLYPDELLDAAPELELGTSEPTWLVDFDGIPLTIAN